jgi:sortase A
MRDRRYVEDLSIEELEQVLLIRRREERLARLTRLGARGIGAARNAAGAFAVDDIASRTPDEPGSARWDRSQDASPVYPEPSTRTQQPKWRERILMGIEGAALLALIVVIASLVVTVRNLNQDWRNQQDNTLLPEPTATPLIRAAVLPGGHVPPATSGGEAQPIGPLLRLTIPTPGPRSPTRLVMPSIDVDVQVVEGDDWEQLKKGAGHHIGSANPGERGNCFISGHNDIYGEIFRYLPEVQVGDEITIYAGEQPYRYAVRATRIVEPDDVSVMYPTSAPILTLLTCYPYMIDTQRFVVIAELIR